MYDILSKVHRIKRAVRCELKQEWIVHKRKVTNIKLFYHKIKDDMHLLSSP